MTSTQIRRTMMSVALCLGWVATAHTQTSAPDTSKDKTATLEKRVSDLEREVKALKEEMKQLRRELHPDLVTNVYSVRGIQAEDVAKALRIIYRDRKGFEVEHLPNLGALVIKADKETMEEVKSIIDIFH